MKIKALLTYLSVSLIFVKISLAQTPDLGTASSFALFTANGAFTNTGASMVTGDIGTNVGAFSGFAPGGPGTVNGQIRLPGSPEADQAATDVMATYSSLSSLTCGTIILPELGGQTLTPGVYCQPTADATSLNGTLTLSGTGLFIIKLSSALTTATNSTIVLINGASACNVFFQVNGAVNLGTGSVFKGTILAAGAISLATEASLEGRGLSTAGAIMLNNNVVTATNSALSINVVVSACAPATNQYSISGIISSTSASAATITLTDGTASTTVAVGAGNASTPYNLTGLTSGTGSHTVTVSCAGSIASATYVAPASCTASSATPIASVSVTPGVSQTATNQYALTGIISLTAAPTGSLTITDGAITTTVSVIAGQTSVVFSLTGLASGTGSHTVVVSGAGYAPVSTTYVAPAYTVPANPSLSVQTYVNASNAAPGAVLTYSVILTNSGSTTATTIVRDSLSTGGTYVINSATTPVGTSFAAGQPISLWYVPLITAGQSLTLTFQVSVDATGILYNVVTVPGDTASVCTSIPVKLCVGDEYTLTVPAGRASYRWYRNGLLIQDQTTNVLVVTQAGSYSLGIDNANGLCPDFSCCPFIVEEDALPAYQAVAIGATCVGSNPQNNGQLVLSNFGPGHTYQYSLGAAFDVTASLSGLPQTIPAGGIISTTLPSSAVSQSYTVRVYNSSGCYVDQIVTVPPTICICPANICVPFILTQTKRPVRIGDPVR